MKIIAVTQARSGSSRLPGKILKQIGNQTLLEIHINRILKSDKIEKLIVATTEAEADAEIEILANSIGIESYRGSEEDVLDRFYQAVKNDQPDFIVRLTSDCPLIDSNLIDKVIDYTINNGLDYCSNTLNPTFPDGQDCEVFTFTSLEKAWKESKLKSDREHVTPYIWRNSSFKGGELFKSDNFSEGYDYGHLRMTVDEPNDFTLIQEVILHQGLDKSWKQYAEFLETNPSISKINDSFNRNEGFIKSLKNDNKMGQGQELYKKAKNLIPGGTMLLSKRPEMFLPEQWPAYFSRAKGCKVWTLEGEELLDMSIMGIGTNLLGYGNEDVDAAVRQVVNNGNMSTFNCPEEVRLAERLVELHPWADMVRTARTGGEANAVAIRIARAASGRDKVAICGYHGWHDWYLSANLSDDEGLDGHLLPGLEPKGVPRNLANTVLPFNYNKIEELKAIVANNPDLGVIKMEVSRNQGPLPGYLEEVRQLANDNNIVLIFDECTSGFRESFGGLHKNYGVNPDMAMFGKALGNGYAITAIAGRREVMEAAQKTFISSTFWTERIGPTAALACLDVMEKTKSWETITNIGAKITERWKRLGENHSLDLKTAGLSALTSFSITSQTDNWLAYKTFISQEMLKKKIIAGNSVYVCTEHRDEYINRYFEELDPIFKTIKDCEEGRKKIHDLLEGPICHGGFKRLN